jgi:hypothetical protein
MTPASSVRSVSRTATIWDIGSHRKFLAVAVVIVAIWKPGKRLKYIGGKVIE